jgi:hypothetical protein
MTVEEVSVVDALRDLVDDPRFVVPHPGSGATPARHRALFEVARTEPVSVARLWEAHTDAVSILHDAGLEPHASSLYGVWASEIPGAAVRLSADRSAVRGTKPFCSGLGIVDRALVTVVDETIGQELLVELTVASSSTVAHDITGWSTPALAETATGAARFDEHPVDRVVSPDHRWYLQRPGFWHGACGPAACWAGGAVGLVDVAEAMIDDDPHRRAHLGAMRALAWGLEAVLDRAGRDIDAAPDDVDAAHARALAVRHLVERSATEILDRFGTALGPRPFVSDPEVAQRFGDVHLYLRQDHGERDLAALGTATTPRRTT